MRQQAFARLRPQGKRRLAVERRNLIDDHIFGKMETDGVEPAPLATDAEFLQRVSLDLSGRIPTIERAEAFLASEDPPKRAQFVEELLKSDDYVERWALF